MLQSRQPTEEERARFKEICLRLQKRYDEIQAENEKLRLQEIESGIYDEIYFNELPKE